MERTIGGTFLDLLDTAGSLAIQERFSEQLTERNEGRTENANPQTVTQPVHPSQFPSGEPRHNLMSFTSPVVLAVGGVALLITGVLLARVLR